jgi:hypothetical protein
VPETLLGIKFAGAVQSRFVGQATNRHFSQFMLDGSKI